MIIERKPKSAIIEQVENFKKDSTVVTESTNTINESSIKPAEALFSVELEKKEKHEGLIECADRKELAEQITKLKEQHIKHKVSKQDGKYVIECFENPVKKEEEQVTEEVVVKEEVKDKEQLTETFAGEDVIDDIIDRAKSKIEEGESVEDAVHNAIDDGLIYTKDIYSLLEHYASIETSTMIESFYEDLYSDVLNGLDIEESLKEEVIEKHKNPLTEDSNSLTSDELEDKIKHAREVEIPEHEERIAKYKKEQEEAKDEKVKNTLSNKIKKAEEQIANINARIEKYEERIAELRKVEDEKVRKDFVDKAKKVFSPGKGHKASKEQIIPTKEEIRAYDSLADFLKDNCTIRIETSPEKEKTLRDMLPDLEEGQYSVIKGETSGGYPMKFGISMNLHVKNLESCPEEFRDMFKDGDLTTVEEVYGLLRTHFDDFKDAITPKESKKLDVEFKKEESLEESKTSVVDKIKSKVLKYLDRIGYNESDFNEYFVIEEKEFVNDDGDKATHIQIRNDLVDFYEAEEGELISELDEIVAPGYFEPYDAYVWDAYVWEDDLKEDLSNVSLDDKDIDEPEKLVEGRYADLSSKLARAKEEFKELKVKLENAPDEESRNELGDLIASKEVEIGDLEGALAEIRYIDNGNASDYSGYEYESLLDEPAIETNVEFAVDDIDDDVSSFEEVSFSTEEVKDIAEEVAEKMIDNIETKGLNIDTEEWKEDATDIVDEKVEEKSEEKVEDDEDDVSSFENSEEVIDVDYSDDDMSEEDMKFFENFTPSNSFKNEVKSEEQQKLDEELNNVVIKDDLGVAEDLDDTSDLDALVSMIK